MQTASINNLNTKKGWALLIIALIVLISILHYSTPTMKWQYHLIYMQSYFIPILIAAFQFGIKGGVGAALVISAIYFPHIMLQWGGLVETNLMRFLQILLFNIIGYLTGLKAEREMAEKVRYQQAASELQKSLQKLQEQSEKISELEEQLRLADRLAIVGELTASLAHEVRNPLGSIQGTVEILRDELPEPYNQSEFFNILIKETQRLNEVVENYLSFTRNRPAAPTVVDLRELLQHLILMISRTARKNKVTIDYQPPPEPLHLSLDVMQMRQVLLNLLLNAIQAMPEGGTLRITTEKRAEQNVEGETNASAVEIQIQDNGQGIDEKNLPRIFKPFFTTKPNGTGLGLSIVKHIVDENKWDISVESKPGQGTTFRLRIPCSPKTDEN